MGSAAIHGGILKEQLAQLFETLDSPLLKSALFEYTFGRISKATWSIPLVIEQALRRVETKSELAVSAITARFSNRR